MYFRRFIYDIQRHTGTLPLWICLGVTSTLVAPFVCSILLLSTHNQQYLNKLIDLLTTVWVSFRENVLILWKQDVGAIRQLHHHSQLSWGTAGSYPLCCSFIGMPREPILCQVNTRIQKENSPVVFLRCWSSVEKVTSTSGPERDRERQCVFTC